MRHRTLSATLAAALILGGCVTAAPRSRQASASAAVIQEVPVRTWGDNQCGSGALSAVLNRYGDPITEKELDARFKKGRNGGVVSLDLLLEARSRGFDAELLPGSAELVKRSVAEQKPVVLMLRVVDMPRKSRDLFHYIVIDGIDRERDLLRMQFGRGKPRWAPLRAIERAWGATGYATLLVHGRSDRRTSDDELLRRAVALQESGKPRAAITIYEQLLATRSDALLFTNLGNARREAGDVDGAEEAYRRALASEPRNRDSLNNLAWLLFEQSKLDEAAALIRQAVTLNGPDHDLVLDTAAEIEAALGNCFVAETHYKAAVMSAPGERRAALEAKAAALPSKCSASAAAAP